MLHTKRWLFLIHRWLGVLLCTFFAMWFISGVVMMYVGYPKLTPTERLAHLPPLHSAAVELEPAQALQMAGLAGPLQDLRLAVASAGRAVYLVQPLRDNDNAAVALPKNTRQRPSAAVVLDAQTGQPLGPVSAAQALASAAAYAGAPVATTYQGLQEEDTFTHARALDTHRPLHRVRLGDAQDTVLYISGSTGEVVLDATRTERGWNYVGAWIHWLYPLRGNAFNAYWADIVNWLSILGIAMVVTGTVVGILRWRFASRYKSGRRTPYVGRMQRWHHISGLLFAAITLTWIFSGLMSMNPWRIFNSGAPALQTQAMHGGPLTLPAQPASVAALLAASPGAVRELRWVRSVGQTLVLAASPGVRVSVLDATTAQPQVLDRAALAAAAARLVDAPVERMGTLSAYDNHYYARTAHTMTGAAERPLPILRVVFADAHATWVHIDPHSGAVLGRVDSHRRTSRWLFALLHSWDWLPLLDQRPLWDVLMIVLSLGGTAMSLTGIVIGWRRLGRKLGAVRRVPAPGQKAKPMPEKSGVFGL